MKHRRVVKRGDGFVVTSKIGDTGGGLQDRTFNVQLIVVDDCCGSSWNSFEKKPGQSSTSGACICGMRTFFTKGLRSHPETRRTPSAHVWLVSTRNDIQRDWLDNDSQRLVRLLSYCVPEIGSGGAGGITSLWL